MRQQVANLDAVVARIAAHQHGIITFARLHEAGLSTSGIRRRVIAGRLHPVYRGVYAVGHAGLSSEGRWFAAVAACGAGAVLSHRSAAELWRLLPPAKGAVHITVPGSGGRAKRHGLVIHRSRSRPLTDRTRRNGIA